MTAAALARLTALIVTVFLAGCDAPHSQESESAVRPPDPPVRTVELTASRDAVKLEGVATILNTDALLQLDADIRSAKVAADFSRAQLARFRLSTMLSRQTLDNAERQAGIDASQLKLLETRLKQTWGENAPFLKTDARQNLIAEISGGEQAIVRFDFPDLAAGEPRNVRVIPLRGGSETRRREVVDGAVGKSCDARRLVLRAHSGRARVEGRRQGAAYRGKPGQSSRRRHSECRYRRLRQPVLVLRRNRRQEIRAQGHFARLSGRWRLSRANGFCAR